MEKIERLVCSSGDHFYTLCNAIKKSWCIRRIIIKPDVTDQEIGMLLAALHRNISKIIFPASIVSRLMNSNDGDFRNFLERSRSVKEISILIQKTENNIHQLLEALMLSGFIRPKHVNATLKIVTFKLTENDMELIDQAMTVLNMTGLALVMKSDINLCEEFATLCDFIINKRLRKVRLDLFSHRWELLRSIKKLVENNNALESFTYKTRYSDTNCDNLERLFGDDFSGESMQNLRSLCLDTGLLFKKGDSFLNLYKIIQHNKIEKLTLLRVTEAVKVCDNIHDMLTGNTSLTQLYMTVDYEKPERRPSLFGNMPGFKFLTDILDKNRTITSMYACENIAGELDYRAMQDLVKRNRRMQNTKVADLITVIFNIMRNSSESNLLPTEIWREILSLIQYDGISIDFSSIVDDLLEDLTIRRVI
jgi:hypothetical protein